MVALLVNVRVILGRTGPVDGAASVTQVPL